LISLRHRFWYGVSVRVRWSRGEFHETPALELAAVSPEQAQRIAALQRRYQVRFETGLNRASSGDPGLATAAVAARAAGLDVAHLP
jgi:hypothetical protein